MTDMCTDYIDDPGRDDALTDGGFTGYLSQTRVSCRYRVMS